jgi:hypothetical protein
MPGSRAHFLDPRAPMLACAFGLMAARNLPDVTVVEDAGMVSDANQRAIEGAALSFILRAGVPASLIRCRSGAASIPAGRSVTGRCSPCGGSAGGQRPPRPAGDNFIYGA